MPGIRNYERYMMLKGGGFCDARLTTESFRRNDMPVVKDTSSVLECCRRGRRAKKVLWRPRRQNRGYKQQGVDAFECVRGAECS
jgi:protein tyrosine phosphatase (PTP) superfamily phosphohydrolase (DUF442 family)